jgi:hypothetical protein
MMHAMQIFPLLRRGFKRQIQPEDIPGVPRNLEASRAFEVYLLGWFTKCTSDYSVRLEICTPAKRGKSTKRNLSSSDCMGTVLPDSLQGFIVARPPLN